MAILRAKMRRKRERVAQAKDKYLVDMTENYEDHQENGPYYSLAPRSK
jgi:hypothetical protein